MSTEGEETAPFATAEETAEESPKPGIRLKPDLHINSVSGFLD